MTVFRDTDRIQRARYTCVRAAGAAGDADKGPAARSTSRVGSTRRSSRRGPRRRPRPPPRPLLPPSSPALAAHRLHARAPHPRSRRTRRTTHNLEQYRVKVRTKI